MTSPVTPYGTDLQTLPNPAANGAIDLDPSMLEGTGRTLLEQSIVRRLTTGTGTVIDSPNDCIDVRGWLSQGWTIQQVQQAAGALKAELTKDERIIDVTVSVALSPSPGGAAGTDTLTIVIQVTSGYGPFSLTLSITDVTVAILTSNQGNFGQ